MAKTVDGTTTNYLYDRDNIVQELSGGSVLSNWLTGRTDEIFTGTDSTGTANFLTDALGSTILLTNSSGSSIAQYAYEPFGNTTVISGSSTNEFQYAGRENDGTGLYFNRARYYHPGFQRFVSEDPIGWRGGTNLTTYVRNSPTNAIDPTGKSPSAMSDVCTMVGAIMDLFSLVTTVTGAADNSTVSAINSATTMASLGCPVEMRICDVISLSVASAGAALIATTVGSRALGGALGEYAGLYSPGILAASGVALPLIDIAGQLVCAQQDAASSTSPPI